VTGTSGANPMELKILLSTKNIESLTILIKEAYLYEVQTKKTTNNCQVIEKIYFFIRLGQVFIWTCQRIRMLQRRKEDLITSKALTE